MAEIGVDVKKAAEFLQQSQVIGIPTETVYGLAGNALDPNALSKIFEVKNRPRFDPLIVHIPYKEHLGLYVKNIDTEILKLIDTFSPGPVTFLLPKMDIIPDLVTAGLPRVAIRIPSHSLFRELLDMLQFPLAAPSANPFGYISPTQAKHVNDQLGEKIPYILDGGQCEVGLESTIVGLDNGELTIYRKGGLDIDAIENIAGKVKVKEFSDSNPAAPGMLKSHYSPKISSRIYEDNIKLSLKTGALRFQNYLNMLPVKNQFILAENGDLNLAAQRLFTGLRWLDNQGFDQIVIELAPETGLGRAINDRLRRAVVQ